MDREDICKLDVQCRLGAGEEVVEFVNLKVCFRIAHINEIRPDVLQPVDGLGHVAVEGLQVEILTAEQPTCCYLPENLVDSVEIAAHDIAQPTVNDSPVLGLRKRRLNVGLPQPMPRNLKELFLRFVREPLAKLFEHLLGDVANSKRHPVDHLLKHREVLVCNVTKILEVVNECSSCLLILQRHISSHVGITSTLLAGAEFFVIDRRLVDLHRVALEI